MSRYELSVLVALFSLGCDATSPSHSHSPGGSGGADMAMGGGAGGSGGGAGGGGGDGSGDCSAAAKLIYVIDDNGMLSSFTPNQTDVTKSVFTDIGTLKCPAGSGYAPFSMSVDRNATAWVEYVDQSNGGPTKMYKVSTVDASCTDTGFMGQQDFSEFGMGFVSNAAMSTDETLFVAGSATFSGSTALGTLDTKALTVTPAGSGMLAGSPELTGNGLGELWAFFPDASNPRVARLDKMTGAESNTIPLGSDVAGMASQWAFAFYGGEFWVFLAKQGAFSGGPTTVYHVIASGLKDQLDTKTRHIVGAGVSTCAPTVPIS
jgi:hypothetical protein